MLVAPNETPIFFKEIGLPVNSVKKTMIIGGDKIGHYLATEMCRLNMDTTIVESNPKTAEELSYLLPKANIICGDGTNRALLMEEGLRDASAICCLTGFDEENLILSLFAKKVVPNIKIIAKINRTSFNEVVRSLDIGSVIYPKFITASQILQHVRVKKNNIGSNVETLNNIGPGLGEVGPTGNFSDFSWYSKVVFILDMLLGRLEIFPFLMRFTPKLKRSKIIK